MSYDDIQPDIRDTQSAVALARCLFTIWEQLDPVEQQRWRDLATADSDDGNHARFMLTVIRVDNQVLPRVRMLDELNPERKNR